MPNRLADATSPYLLQHKDNPVDWWEWGQEAFDEAKRLDRPVILSVGYAACHWCHVMAHESFEDPFTAEQMNSRFVSIKVDREERPDVDSVYMESVQAMTGHAGWPMTVFMDHDGRPFFAGTYFPKEQRHGMSSFNEVLDAIHEAWTNRRDDIDDQASRLVAAISADLPAGFRMGPEDLAQAYRAVANAYDETHGGFGTAPKFPQQPVLEFLLRIHEELWAPEAAAILTSTLDSMARGGIHDHVGGGFARYSVDSKWLVPHFEKMLYDNAQLARLYLWAGIEFGRKDFLDVAIKTLEYLERDLRHPDGGFYSSEDADSEGVEGKFYVWSASQIAGALGEHATDFMKAYGVTESGNFEGANILNFQGTDGAQWESALERLMEVRAGRIRPDLDDKVVTSWNGLAIRAFAEAGAALSNQHYLRIAEEAAKFVTSELIVDGRLMRSWREGRVSVPGFLDDYSAMATALLTLYAATGDESWFESALRLIEGFETFAKPAGGFFNTANDSESLVKRPSDFTDNPMPSGSGLAAEALLMASLYTGDARYRDSADGALQLAAAVGQRYPTMVGHHLAVIHSASDTRELAIVGDDWKDLAEVFWARYRPNIVLAGAPSSTPSVPLLDGRDAPTTQAYLCRGFVCDLPTSTREALKASLTS